ncbi:MAG: AAA family ATPase [Desulfovibrionaceae bacterium]
MRIRSFHMDGFGIFSDVTVPALPAGLSIFLGNNEAGKSTCLDFFRTMLMGYPDHRSKENSHPPLRGGQAGGSLTLDTLQYGLVRLTRRTGTGGGLVSLSDASGKALDAAVLDQILAGVTREVYRTVFGFSLTELQNFDSLNAEGVRHALYGASFGMGLRSPHQLFKQLDEQMESLFKPGGSKPALNATFRQWDEITKDIIAAEQACAQFDTLSLELSAADQSYKNSRQRKHAMEHERRQVERRLGVWRQWDEWRNLKARIDRLEPIAPTFPEDGPARLTRAMENTETAARQLTLVQERLQRTRDTITAAQLKPDMLAALPEIQSLTERKTSYRQACTSLPAQEAALKRSQADLQRLLNGLGPDWTCERIRQTNRSLFAREELERQANEMNAALSAHTAAVDNLEKANRAVEKAEHDVEKEQQRLQHLPMPVSSLDDAGRDTLRRTLARIEEVRSRLPERQRALREANSTFARTYEPLQLHPGKPEQLLQNLADSQNEALELSQTVQEHMRATHAADLAAAAAQEAEETVRSRIERLRAQHLANHGPTRAALDARTVAVRSLRHVTANLSVEQDRLREMDDRKAAMVAPAPLKSWWLITLGLGLMLAGLGMLLVLWQWGITIITLTPQIILPTSWLGYLGVLSGVAFLAGGLPRSGPEAKRHLAETEILGKRLSDVRQRIAELKGQIAGLCATAEVDSADAITLDATEMLLERERELCVTEERLSQDMADLQTEYGLSKEKTRQAHNTRQQTESRVQQCRRRWHDFLLSCHVDSVPAPEAAGVFFGRVEAARVAHAAVLTVEAECAHLQHSLDEQYSLAMALPPVAELVSQAQAMALTLNPDTKAPPQAPLESVLNALQQVTEACREADAATEERLKASAAVSNAESNMERAEILQHDSATALKEADHRLTTARALWRENLQSLGLGVELSPPTVREALESMERCLSAEAEVARLNDDITRLEREKDALTLPMQALLTRFGHPLKHDSDGAVHWIACLDSLLQEALAMEKLDTELQRLHANCLEQQDLLRSAEATLADARQAQDSLLEQAGLSDTEDFLRHARIKEERENCLRRQADLEDALTLAAAPQPFDEFINSFAEFDRAEREMYVGQLAETIETLDQQERDINTRMAELNAQISILSTADHLAQLRQRQASLAESMRCMAYEWSRNAVARRLLEEAKHRFEQERQPQVIRTASEIFAGITQGAWIKIAASLEDSSLTVLPGLEQGQGSPLPPSVLSRGTQEQLYLALRLAYIRNHATHASALPVIMDDILVNFDPTRARQSAQALLALTQGGANPAHQILFFTCHPHMADMLHSVMPASQVFKVNKGTITAG